MRSITAAIAGAAFATALTTGAMVAGAHTAHQSTHKGHTVECVRTVRHGDAYMNQCRRVPPRAPYMTHTCAAVHNDVNCYDPRHGGSYIRLYPGSAELLCVTFVARPADDYCTVNR